MKLLEPLLKKLLALISYLDYASFYDTSGGKVHAWIATCVAAGEVIHRFVIFFEDSSKDAVCGMRAWHVILDPEQGPKDGVSHLANIFPDVMRAFLSGDTGNGFRSYAMLYFLSHVKQLYGLEIELIPLAPSHGFNLCDNYTAHPLNSLFNRLKKRGALVGAQAYANALSDGKPTRCTLPPSSLSPRCSLM